MFSTGSADALRNVYLWFQLLVDEMRGRSTKKYLTTINQRTKWFDEQKSIDDENDLIFVTRV